MRRVYSMPGISGRQALLLFTMLSTTLSGHAFAADAPDAAERRPDIAETTTVVVTGSRSATTEFKSASPVSVVTAKTLESTGQPDLRTSLSAVAPAYLASQTSNGSSSSKPVRTAALRGLGGNHVLVLVNGRRRHNTSLLNNTGGTGGAPVDLGLIPSGAVARIEVLSDGASAQYGSDAIGGVVNIILKKNASGGSLDAQTGSYNKAASKQGGLGDAGLTSSVNFNQGLKIGQDGFLNISAEYRRVLDSNVDGPTGAPTNSVRQIYATPNDPRETSETRYRQENEVVPWGWAANFSGNLELPLSEGVTLYADATRSTGSLWSNGTYRNENNPATLLGIAPEGGYLPQLDTKQADYEAVAGLRGDDLLGWHWNASLSYGRNRANMYVNGINASLGDAATYQTFYIGQLQASEAIANFDITRSFRTSWFAEPLEVAAGIEYRYNDFSEGAGEVNSYANGGYIYPADYPSAALRNTAAGIGSPFMTGFTPDEAGDWDRNSQAAYIDFSQYVTSALKLGLAARYENFSDFGGALSGKFTARYEFSPNFALRASVNNGFRAPSLAEQFTTVANQGPFNTGTQIIQVNSYNSIRYDAPAAQALGAKALQPEESLNYSAGFVAKPLPNLNITVDAFQIEIDDRIGLTGQFNGTANTAAGRAVAAALVAAGIDPNVRVQYFANIGDTRTRGIEFKVNYASDFGRWGKVNWGLSSALNRQKVTRATPARADLAAAGLVLLQNSARVTLENGSPREITRGTIDWSIGDFDIRLAETHYSQTRATNSAFPNDPNYDSVSRPAYITDLNIGYDITDHVRLTVGANNLFNKRADNIPEIAVPLITTGYVYPAPVAAPFGIGGRFTYARLGLSW